MIPLVIPPLQGLGVLVTRPVDQAATLLQSLQQQGARVLHWPVLRIEPIITAPNAMQACDLLIFISVNAVRHGSAWLNAYPQARIAAVGAATATALRAAGYEVDVEPDQASNSEALLMHPLLLTPPAYITLVRGRGGRELLHDTLTQRGAEVTVAEVYERAPITPSADALSALQQALQDEWLDMVTATSVETLQALRAGLPATQFAQLQAFTLLAGSTRIAVNARELGWRGEIVTARSPQDEHLLQALIRWHARQRN